MVQRNGIVKIDNDKNLRKKKVQKRKTMYERLISFREMKKMIVCFQNDWKNPNTNDWKLREQTWKKRDRLLMKEKFF